MSNTILTAIQEQFERDLASARELKDIEALKIRYLGKKGLIQEQMKHLREVPPEEKPAFGKMVNDLKLQVEARLAHEEEMLLSKEEAERLRSETIDITLPGRNKTIGSKHPVAQMLDEINEIFISMGFTVQTGPQVESNYYNFDVLNISEDHPARDMQDTFYVSPTHVLRTHTTNVQGRVMEFSKPPIRIICPGRVFRNEEVSSRSHVFFHQVDGLYVDENVSMQDLVKTLTAFVHKLFDKAIKVRFRPSYFPFVEPGCEVDIACFLCRGAGCSICKKSGWLEILGAGMIHPQVLRNVGIDPEKYTGFAWGMGVERLTLSKYGINDIRHFAENDMRFLGQFPKL